jgi:hypothetical protein
LIVDAHTDVLLETVVRGRSLELALHPGLFEHYWLPRLVAGGVVIQICPLYGEGSRRSDARPHARSGGGVQARPRGEL